MPIILRKVAVKALSSAAMVGLGIIIVGGQKGFGRAPQEEWFTRLFVVDGHTHDAVPAYGEQPKQAGLKRLLAAGLDGIILSFPLDPAAPEDVIVRALIEAGYAIDQVQKIMGGNLVRFFSSKQDGADPKATTGFIRAARPDPAMTRRSQ